MIPAGPRRSLLWLTAYALAMAYFEAAMVVALRAIHYPGNPLAVFPLQVLAGADLIIELGREIATLMMILGVALLAERSATRIFAAFVYVFGLWDMFYYVWLKVLIGWPVHWTEWDVLFLIPWPWIAPWMTAAAIALLLAIWSAWVLASPLAYRMRPGAMSLFSLGALLCVTAFLQPAFRPLLAGPDDLRGFVPRDFWWPAYAGGYALMAIGLEQTRRRISTGTSTRGDTR